MTVSELIAVLAALPPDMPVVVDGFDQWGFNEVRIAEAIDLFPVAPQSHGPDFDTQDSIARTRAQITGEAVKAIYISS